MSEPDRPVDHLLRAAEELLRAGLALTARKPPSALVDQLAAAFEAEAERWEQRAEHDPAAKRVRDVMRAVRDVLRPDNGPSPPTPARPNPGPVSRKHRAPRRSTGDVH